ncbi:hypothetical protein PUNSTDRAFT_137231 [Punctularia strigosozonata HHB-11173 SS5]|uniref:uncharacterized protein n=1 Tax=Punctularia strigosozonata (strain HHB-11173) TaxID=741275 RepID=UPI00044165DF|nr:uncharacterized protein PUNSTDRAFT_137231 [Punctularia strigosozonata HHB-11173 SS5]EIN05737.1 hypothetical protein PUNSTDRAFT_137231 [Punctularia strigosozonata HHB-11173 SS5]
MLPTTESKDSYVLVHGDPPSPTPFGADDDTPSVPSKPDLAKILSSAHGLQAQLEALEAQSNCVQFHIGLNTERHADLKAELEHLQMREKHQKEVTKLLLLDLARLKSNPSSLALPLPAPAPGECRCSLLAVPLSQPSASSSSSSSSTSRPGPMLERMNTLKLRSLGKRIWSSAKKDDPARLSLRKKRSALSLRLRLARTPSTSDDAHEKNLKTTRRRRASSAASMGKAGSTRKAAALDIKPVEALKEACATPNGGKISKATWKTAINRRREDVAA